MIGIDLFAGAGGMSVGAAAAGVDIRAAVEIDANAAATYAANHPGVSLHRGDIRNFSGVPFAALPRPMIVFGGPPCQGFSTSNQRTRKADNEKNWLFKEFVRVVGEVQPEWVLIENVSGMLQTEDGLFVEEIRRSLEALSYTVTVQLLNACDFGVPQRRARLFFIGSIEGRTITVAQPDSPIATVWDAISDLPELNNGASQSRLPYPTSQCSDYARELRCETGDCANHLVTRNAQFVLDRYPHVPAGGNWEDIPLELMANYKEVTGCHTGIYHRLAPDQPAKVIANFRKNMLIHPSQHRGLSVREAARLQSFPDWFEFVGSIGFQQQQVGNAVPPLLAQSVFSAITAAQ
jgi:DNA (cytosine-5)-methyltransferase 1